MPTFQKDRVCNIHPALPWSHPSFAPEAPLLSYSSGLIELPGAHWPELDSIYRRMCRGKERDGRWAGTTEMDGLHSSERRAHKPRVCSLPLPPQRRAQPVVPESTGLFRAAELWRYRIRIRIRISSSSSIIIMAEKHLQANDFHQVSHRGTNKHNKCYYKLMHA